MSTKSIIAIVALICMSVTLLSSCITTKYSKTDIPGIRQLDKFDDDVHIGTSFQKRDADTFEWYEAEKNDAGEWNFTAKGKKNREMDIRQRKDREGDGKGP